MKNFKNSTSTTRVAATALLSVLILSTSNMSLGASGELYPGETGPSGQAATTNQGDSDNALSRLFHRIGAAFSRTSNDDSTPASSIVRRKVSQLRKDDNCLILAEDEEFYPLYDMKDPDIQPTTYLDPRIKDISVNLNGLAPEALRKSRAAGIDVHDWPIVLIGPVTFCGSVDLQFQADLSKFVSKRNFRVEIGPNVTVKGIRNVSIVSSQLKNVEITGACVGANNFSSETPCVRIEESLRTSPNHMLYFKHDGPKICRIDKQNLTGLELQVEGYSKAKPLPCKWVSEHAAFIEDAVEAQPSLAAQPAAIPIQGTAVRPTTVCNGPYFALLQPKEVSLDYGVRPHAVVPQIAPIAEAPTAVVAPVPPAAPVASAPVTTVQNDKIDPKTGRPYAYRLNKPKAKAAAKVAPDPMINAPRGDK